MGTSGRAVTYGRQSRERGDESAASPQAQREQTAAFVTARGWEHAGHYEDVGLSGYDPRVARPQLEALLTRVREGGIEHVVVFKLDRLTRRGVVEAVRLVGELAEHGAGVASVEEPFLDTSTPMGLAIYGMFAALAQQESANISTRTRAAKAVLRAGGSWSGGNPPFGTQTVRVFRDGLSLTQLQEHPTEAPVIREVVARVLAGASISGEAKRLNTEGVPTRAGGQWSTATLSRTLRSPAMAGYLPQRRQRGNSGHYDISPARDLDGQPVSVGAAIVDPSAWWALLDIVSSRQGGRGPKPSATLLGGWEPLICAACGSRMDGDRRGSAGGSYRCARHRSGKTGCDGVAVSMKHTDEYIVRCVWERLRDLDLDDPTDAETFLTVAARYRDSTADAATETALRIARSTAADVEARLRDLDDDRAQGAFPGISGAERYRRQVAVLAERADTAAAEVAHLEALTDDDGVDALLDVLAELRSGEMTPESPDSPWQTWTNDERRDFLSLFLDRVEVHKGRHGGGNAPFRAEERFTLTWAGEAAPF